MVDRVPLMVVNRMFTYYIYICIKVWNEKKNSVQIILLQMWAEFTAEQTAETDYVQELIE